MKCKKWGKTFLLFFMPKQRKKLKELEYQSQQIISELNRGLL